MKINTKVRYGLRAMIEISTNSFNVGMLQKEISENQNIPIKYLDTIISGLRNAGLIINHAGKSSGYILSKPSDQITIYDIYRAFEPELELVNCRCATNECKRLNICPTKDYWFELNYKIKQIMKSSTLDKIAIENENVINN